MITRKSDLQKRHLPSVFTNVLPHASNVQYDSLELCKKNAKLRHSLNEIYVLSFDTIMKLIDDVRMYIGCLYKVCEGIAMLDMVHRLPVCVLIQLGSFAYSTTLVDMGNHPEF